MTLRESLHRWLTGEGKANRTTKQGRNDRKHNHNKYGVKVATDNNCLFVTSNGSIAVRFTPVPKKKKKGGKR